MSSSEKIHWHGEDGRALCGVVMSEAAIEVAQGVGAPNGWHDPIVASYCKRCIKGAIRRDFLGEV